MRLCGLCRGDDSRQLLNVAMVPEDVIAVDYLEVGRYALQFLWTDGHSTGIYPFRMLRRLAAEDDVVVCSMVPEDVIAVDYLEVGRYALQFLWTDGHSTGIYPFRMLRRLAAEDDVVVCS